MGVCYLFSYNQPPGYYVGPFQSTRIVDTPPNQTDYYAFNLSADQAVTLGLNRPG